MTLMNKQLLIMVIILNLALSSLASKKKPLKPYFDPFKTNIKRKTEEPKKQEENNIQKLYDAENAADYEKYVSKVYDEKKNERAWKKYLPKNPRDQKDCGNCWAFSIAQMYEVFISSKINKCSYDFRRRLFC